MIVFDSFYMSLFFWGDLFGRARAFQSLGYSTAHSRPCQLLGIIMFESALVVGIEARRHRKGTAIQVVELLDILYDCRPAGLTAAAAILCELLLLAAGMTCFEYLLVLFRPPQLASSRALIPIPLCISRGTLVRAQAIRLAHAASFAHSGGNIPKFV